MAYRSILINNRCKMLKKIAFQGEKGAFSEEAILSFFDSQIVTLPCNFLNDVFRVVESGKADMGMVPVENSIEGSINQTYDLLLTSNLKICGEFVLRINHNLIANFNVDLTKIKKVYSHPQALAQCRTFLESLRVEQIPFYDTAGSVKMIHDNRHDDAAAIASKRAAEEYNMKILSESIEDSSYNYTRFLVLNKDDHEITGNDKTSVVFSTNHIPGALHKVLGEFAERNINLTKIESRPIRNKVWEYTFFVEIEGHRTEIKIIESLKQLSKFTLFTKILGSYPKSHN